MKSQPGQPIKEFVFIDRNMCDDDLDDNDFFIEDEVDLVDDDSFDY